MTCSCGLPPTARTARARRSRLALSTHTRPARVPSLYGDAPNGAPHTSSIVLRWRCCDAPSNVPHALGTVRYPSNAPIFGNRSQIYARLCHWALPRSPWHPSDAAHLRGMGAVVSTCMQGRAPIGRGTPPCFGSRSRASCVVPPCASFQKVYPSRSCKRSLRHSGWYAWQRGWRASGQARRVPCSPLGASETQGGSCTASDPGGHSPSRRRPHATRAPLLGGST